jgi:hypothetical protein
MTDQPELDPAIMMVIAECSDRIQKRLTDAINAEIADLIVQGHCASLVIPGAISGASTLLFSIIAFRVEPDHQMPTLLDSFRHLAAALGRRHGELAAGVPDGVTVQ